MVAEGRVAASGSPSKPTFHVPLSHSLLLLVGCKTLVSFSRYRGTTAWRRLTMCILITILSPGLVSRVRESRRRVASRWNIGSVEIAEADR